MERTFAGFWVDGAVREPDDRHTDGSRGVLVKIKGDNRFERFTVRGGAWDKVYWLDTTTPTELTPQQAFELLKVVFPKAKRIIRDSAFAITFDCDGETSIVWGETTEYPPRERWRLPTDADKGKRCRYRDNDKAVWIAREDVSFMCTWNDSFWVVYGKEVPCLWKFCEVLE
jgi:hypothetical protein